MKGYSKILLGYMLSFSLFILEENPAVAYQEIEVQGGGEISGTVLLKGAVPVLEPLNVDRNTDYCGKTVPDESILVNSGNNGIQNVVVSLDRVEKGKKRQPETIVLENLKCRFSPHILAAMVGDSYEVKNSDPVLHNTHLRQDGFGSILNIALPPNIQNVIKRTIEHPGTIHANCDAHRFMTAEMRVFNHPYFAVTNAAGHFSLTNVPPGKYILIAWHETLPVVEKEISLDPGQKLDLSLSLAPKKK